MKKALYVTILLAMTISGSKGTAVWAAEMFTDVTAFEKQIAETLTVRQFMTAVQVGYTKMTLFHGNGNSVPLQLEAAPYINADGVLMVAAEDVGRFLGWGKTRNEFYWDENGKRVMVSVKNKVEWEKETGKIRIEVPWRETENFSAASSSPYAPSWIPYEEGETIEPWEGSFDWKDGKKKKKGKVFIEMTVGSNIWRYKGYGYIAGTNCEQRDGRVYLPMKDIHQTLLPYSQYYWDRESKILAMIEGYRY